MTPLDLFPKPKNHLCGLGGGGSGGGGGISGQIYQPQNQPGIDTNWNSLYQGLLGQQNAGTSPGQEWLPYATATGQNIYNNPFQNQAIGASQNAAGLQQFLAPGQLGAAQQIGNFGSLAEPYGQLALQQGNNPAYGQAMSLGANMVGPMLSNAGQLSQAGQQDLATGYDPQSALYNRTQSQVADQINAQLANSGLGGTP